jgi:hypothetical protein
MYGSGGEGGGGGGAEGTQTEQRKLMGCVRFNEKGIKRKEWIFMWEQ